MKDMHEQHQSGASNPSAGDADALLLKLVRALARAAAREDHANAIRVEHERLAPPAVTALLRPEAEQLGDS